MIINDPTIYFGKKIKVFSTSGRVTTGELYGYVENEHGLLIGFTEDEIERIEIIG